MRKRCCLLTAALLLAALLAGCSGAGAPSAEKPAALSPAPGAGAAPAAAAPAQSAGNGEFTPPSQSSAQPEGDGYRQFALRFFDALKRGDAFGAASYIRFENEDDRALWIERFYPPFNPSLSELRCEYPNLWAATITEDFGGEAPATRTVYCIAYYQGSFRVFPDPFPLPEDLDLEHDYSAMPLPEETKTGGGAKTEPGEDAFPPEDGQAEKWYRDRQAELAAVKAAAEKAVRAMPEAKTVTSFDNPTVQFVEAAKLDFIKIEPMGSKLLVYAVSYPTTADETLGPIVVYLDSEANVLGVAPRE